MITPFKVTVNPNVEVCEGERVQLSAEGGVSYEWSPANGLDNPYVAAPYASPDNSTVYMVKAHDGICFYDSATITVIVHTLPTIDAGEDQLILAGETVALGANGTGTYSWTPADNLSCADCPNPNATPEQTTTYVVTVTNDFGCARYDSVIVRVGCEDDIAFVPNAFSPNGDGLNERFLIRSTGLRKLDYLRIYDRWGNLMYESTDVHEGWDGLYRNKPVMPGTYVYYMQATCSNGQQIMKQGNLTLIR